MTNQQPRKPGKPRKPGQRRPNNPSGTAGSAGPAPAAEPQDTAGAAEPAKITAAPAESDAVERAPSKASPVKPAAGKLRPTTRSANILIGVLLAALGFAIAVQIRSVSSSDALSGARPDELARILSDLNSQQSRLQGQIAQLQDELRKLNENGNRDTAARNAAKEKADALGVLTGTLPATGPGIVLTITDPKHKLAAEDLLDVIEELRGSGAEALQFGPVRVTTSSAFVDTDEGIQLDGVPIAAPYTVLAIGPPSTMATALRIPDGVVSAVGSAGGSATIDQRDTVDIKVVRPLPTTKYSTPQK
jgi:uncharacterized protein YlxW (UPF0749 family)